MEIHLMMKWDLDLRKDVMRENLSNCQKMDR